MLQIDNLSSEARQVTKLALSDGALLTLGLTYEPAIQRWRIDVAHPRLTIDGMNLCVHPNVLRQWRKKIDFGLACTSKDGADPVYVEDFSSGRITLFVLSKEEVADIEAEIEALP